MRSKPSPQMFMLLGRTCQNAGDHTQAIDAFDRAIEAIVSNNYCKSYLCVNLWPGMSTYLLYHFRFWNSKLYDIPYERLCNCTPIIIYKVP